MTTWKVSDIGIYRWGNVALQDFVYVLLTNNQRYECFYALHDALYAQEYLEMLYGKIEQAITARLPEGNAQITFFRVEAHLAGYDVAPGKLRLWEHGKGECAHVPEQLYTWFHNILSETISQRKPA